MPSAGLHEALHRTEQLGGLLVHRGDQPLDAAGQMLSAVLRTTNPGPWIEGQNGTSAVIADGRLEAVLSLSQAHDGSVRDRLAPFKRVRRLEFAELPKTISVKIRRVELRRAEDDRAAAGKRETAEFREEDFPELRQTN